MKLLKTFMHDNKQYEEKMADYVSRVPHERNLEVYKEQLRQVGDKLSSILQNVSVFSSLGKEQLEVMAYSMERRVFRRGDKIIRQDDLGDAFYILEYGEVSVTRKKDTSDLNELDKELVRLRDGAHFGEMALITDELRSASITVTSEVAHCTVMTKEIFDACMAENRRLAAEGMRIIGEGVISQMPLFKGMSKFNKKHLLDALVPITFSSNTYICREGTGGSTFYIITEGNVRVTLNVEGAEEKEVGSLGTGDFFGEMALMSEQKIRNANCIAIGKVTCMTLSAPDFDRLMRSQQAQLGKFASETKRHTEKSREDTVGGQYRRRITGFDENNRPNAQLTSGLFLQMARYMYEALWLSMYWKFYRRCSFKVSLIPTYGPLCEEVMANHIRKDRRSAVVSLEELLVETLSVPPDDRTDDQVRLIYGFLTTKNEFIRDFCEGWTEKQLMQLSMRVRFRRVRSITHLWRVNELCTAAYLILKGSVRVFKGVRSEHTGNYSSVYQEEKVPGEIIGESVLEGMNTRLYTIQTVTRAEFLVIEEDDYKRVLGQTIDRLSVQERFQLLSAMSIFSSWDSYRLYGIAQVLQQKMVAERTSFFSIDKPADKLYFLLKGSIDVLSPINHSTRITKLLPGDFFGETSVLEFFFGRTTNARTNKRNHKGSTAPEWIEVTHLLAGQGVEVLSVEPIHFGLFDLATVRLFEDQHLQRKQWRLERAKAAMKETRVQKQLKRQAKSIGAQLAEGVEVDLEDDGVSSSSVTYRGNEEESATVDGDDNSLAGVVPAVPSSNNSVAPSVSSHLTSASMGSVANLRKMMLAQKEKKFAQDILDLTTSLDDSLDPIFAMNTCKNERTKKKVLKTFGYAQQTKIIRNARETLKQNDDVSLNSLFPPLRPSSNEEGSMDEMSSLGSIGPGQSLSSFGTLSLMMDTRRIPLPTNPL